MYRETDRQRETERCGLIFQYLDADVVIWFFANQTTPNSIQSITWTGNPGHLQVTRNSGHLQVSALPWTCDQQRDCQNACTKSARLGLGRSVDIVFVCFCHPSIYCMNVGAFCRLQLQGVVFIICVRFSLSKLCILM